MIATKISKFIVQSYDDLWAFVAPEGKEARWAYSLIAIAVLIVMGAKLLAEPAPETKPIHGSPTGIVAADHVSKDAPATCTPRHRALHPAQTPGAS